MREMMIEERVREVGGDCHGASLNGLSGSPPPHSCLHVRVQEVPRCIDVPLLAGVTYLEGNVRQV